MHSTNPLLNHDKLWFVTWRDGGKIHTRTHSKREYVTRSINNLVRFYGVDIDQIAIFKGHRYQLVEA